MKAAAIAIVLDASNSSVLLTKRSDVPIWVLPGGGIEEGESPQEAVMREVFEETGVRLEEIYPCIEYLPINRWTAAVHLFRARSKEFPLPLSECTAAAFFPLDDLPKPLFRFHKEWLYEGLAIDERLTKRMSHLTFMRILIDGFFHPLWTRSFLQTRAKLR